MIQKNMIQKAQICLTFSQQLSHDQSILLVHPSVQEEVNITSYQSYKISTAASRSVATEDNGFNIPANARKE